MRLLGRWLAPSQWLGQDPKKWARLQDPNLASVSALANVQVSGNNVQKTPLSRLAVAQFCTQLKSAVLCGYKESLSPFRNSNKKRFNTVYYLVNLLGQSSQAMYPTAGYQYCELLATLNQSRRHQR